jgi:hypothetical protein
MDLFIKWTVAIVGGIALITAIIRAMRDKE